MASGSRSGLAARILMGRIGLPLDRFGRRSPYRLSGGEQRRLSLATALVREPAVLVLDEPTFGQDRLGYEGLLEILDERLAAGATLIAATHDQRFVADATTRSSSSTGAGSSSDERAPMISDRLELDEPRLASPLGRVSPVVKLAIALVWLVGLAFTTRILPPLFLALVAIVAGLWLGRIPGRRWRERRRRCGSPRS